MKLTSPMMTFTISNGEASKGKPRLAAHFKRMGLNADIPDLLFWWGENSYEFHGVLEMKRPGKKPTPGQRNFLENIKSPFFSAWADNYQDAIGTLQDWGVFRPGVKL